jgi:hypothetical protein
MNTLSLKEIKAKEAREKKEQEEKQKELAFKKKRVKNWYIKDILGAPLGQGKDCLKVICGETFDSEHKAYFFTHLVPVSIKYLKAGFTFVDHEGKEWNCLYEKGWRDEFFKSQNVEDVECKKTKDEIDKILKHYLLGMEHVDKQMLVEDVKDEKKLNEEYKIEF